MMKPPARPPAAAQPADAPPPGFNVVRLHPRPPAAAPRQNGGQADLGLFQAAPADGDSTQTPRPCSSFMKEALARAAEMKKQQGALQLEAAPPPPDRENEPLEVPALARLGLRDEHLAMEFPLFSLSKGPDVQERTYHRGGGGGGFVTVMPPACGAATVFDHDLLIYCASVVTGFLNRKATPSRTLVIDTLDFLRKTRRGEGGRDYEGMVGMLDRLCGTRIKTDVLTNGVRQIKAFGIIEGYEILLKKERAGLRENPKTGQKEPRDTVSVLRFSVTLSQWYYNSIRHDEAVLAIDEDYFRLDSAVERRLYQIARHHCGDKPLWKIGIERLRDKVGTRREMFRFRDDLRNAIRDDRIPGYRVALDSAAKPGTVVFYRRGRTPEEHQKINADISKALLAMKGNGFQWFGSLEKTGSDAIKNRPDANQRKARQAELAAARKAAKEVRQDGGEGHAP